MALNTELKSYVESIDRLGVAFAELSRLDRAVAERDRVIEVLSATLDVEVARRQRSELTILALQKHSAKTANTLAKYEADRSMQTLDNIRRYNAQAAVRDHYGKGQPGVQCEAVAAALYVPASDVVAFCRLVADGLQVPEIAEPAKTEVGGLGAALDAES